MNRKNLVLGLLLFTIVTTSMITVAFEKNQEGNGYSPLYKVCAAKALNREKNIRTKFLKDRITILSLIKIFLETGDPNRIHMWMKTGAPITCPLAKCLTADCHTVYPVCSQDSEMYLLLPKRMTHDIITCSYTCRWGALCRTFSHTCNCHTIHSDSD